MLTAYGDVELAVKALKNGAADFLLKPWDNQTLIDKVTEAYRSRKAPERTAKVDRAEGFEMLVGRSPAMLQLMKVVSKVARTDANILITGENGTGKEILAREIHRLSPRGALPMLNVDMGAISESLFESELFGHERGAFTDAHESRPGKFEAPNGSSLFMDELGNLPLPLQTKLLTVLQSRNVTRLGSNKVIPVDIRLISATNNDIPEMVKQGMFRGRPVLPHQHHSSGTASPT
jgi:Response regulator containing CheY-like receiver, AAA-type ATPase, and DNA-binding domains